MRIYCICRIYTVYTEVVAVQILLQHTGGKPIYEQIAEQMKAHDKAGV